MNTYIDTLNVNDLRPCVPKWSAVIVLNMRFDIKWTRQNDFHFQMILSNAFLHEICVFRLQFH